MKQRLRGSILFLVLCVPLLLFCNTIRAQKVGLVLSGGGASGLAHIGVIKALEENHIPIDYITGTSMGALIGAMYSIGYSPDEMEKLVTSQAFKNWATGVIDNKYVYYFKQNDADGSWIAIKLSLDSAITTSLPTHLISPIPMDFALMQRMAPAAAAAKYDFDSLFVPFRCVASDIEAKQPVIFKSGSLEEAVRASMSFPFYLKPITVNGKLLFDGGLYNNFPSNVMIKDFFPDYIIGSSVAKNFPPPKEDNLISQIKSMLVSKTNYNLNCKDGIIIEPKTDAGNFDFDHPQEVIDSGYAAAMRAIPTIKEYVASRSDSVTLSKKRAAFKKREPALAFDNIKIVGLNKAQSTYVQKLLSHKSKVVSIDQLKPEYFRLVADNKIKNIYPTAKFNPSTGYYTLHLKIKKEKDIITHFGGDFSNRPISEGFVGFQYNYLGKTAISVMGNTYFGKLYTSAQGKTRIDFPNRLPFYIEPSLTYNRWDFFKSSTAFFEDVKPSYLIQRDEYGKLNIGIPGGNHSKIVAGGALSFLTDYYYQTDQYTSADTADRTDFNAITSNLTYEMNTLNRKQYANEGTHIILKGQYVNGTEYNQPGSTSIDTAHSQKAHEWEQFKFVFDNYYKGRGTLKLGVYLEGVYSSQPAFNNYTASILSAPAFQPTPDSKTYFLKNYRAFKYLAGGLKNIISLRKNIDLRLEGYIFWPYQAILQNQDLTTGYGGIFATKHFIASGAAVYYSPLGPISISVNYYDRKQAPFTFLFHFGYTIFNKKSIN